MTVSISGAIDFLQDKYALSPALQGLVISSIMIGGVIGAGSNRMNVYTVAKASQGLADYLKKRFSAPSR